MTRKGAELFVALATCRPGICTPLVLCVQRHNRCKHVNGYRIVETCFFIVNRIMTESLNNIIVASVVVIVVLLFATVLCSVEWWMYLTEYPSVSVHHP
jgi:hypothetical protein